MKPTKRPCRTCKQTRKFLSDHEDCTDCRRVWNFRQRAADKIRGRK